MWNNYINKLITYSFNYIIFNYIINSKKINDFDVIYKFSPICTKNSVKGCRFFCILDVRFEEKGVCGF